MNIKFSFSMPVKPLMGPHETQILYCEDFRDLLQNESLMKVYGPFLSKPRIYRILKNCNVGEVDEMFLCLAEGEIDNLQSVFAFLKFMGPLIDAPVPVFMGYFHVDGDLAPWVLFGKGGEIKAMNLTPMAQELLEQNNYLRDYAGFVDLVKRDDGCLEMFFESRKTFKMVGDADDATEPASIVIEL